MTVACGGAQATIGISARTSVGPPGGLDTVNVPSTPATRLASPASPPPGTDGRAAGTVVPDLDDQALAPPGGSAPRSGSRPLCLATFASASATTKYAAARSAAGSRSPGASVADERRSAPGRGRRSTRAPATSPRSSRIDGAMPRTRSRISASASRACAWPSRISCLRGRRIGVDALAREAEVDREHDEPLLGAVVEVALDPVQLARLDVEDGRAALAERLDLAPQLAALRGAEQARHDAAVERDRRAATATRRPAAARAPSDGPGRHGQRVVARRAAARSSGSVHRSPRRTRSAS